MPPGRSHMGRGSSYRLGPPLARAVAPNEAGRSPSPAAQLNARFSNLILQASIPLLATEKAGATPGSPRARKRPRFRAPRSGSSDAGASDKGRDHRLDARQNQDTRSSATQDC